LVATAEKGGVTKTDQPALVKLLLDRAEREPESLALRVKRLGLWQETSWGELARSVRDLARGLSAVGVKAGDAVAVLAEATPEALALDLAVQALGGAVLPINPYSSMADVRYLVDLAGATRLVVGDLETLDRISAAKELDGSAITTTVIVEGTPFRPVRDWRLLPFAELAALGREGGGETLSDLAAARRADEPMSLHPTAGTSGQPRLAKLSSQALVAAWSELLESFSASPADAFVVEAPLSHVTGRAAVLLLPLLFGAVAHFPEHPAAVDEAMAEVAPTLSVALPQRWESRAGELRGRVRESSPIHRWAYRTAISGRGRLSPLAQWLVLNPIRNKLGLRRLRAAATGGRYVPPDLLEFWRTVGVPLIEFYGATEACGLIAFQPGPLPAGQGLRPLSRVQVRIGHESEIEVSGASVAAKGWLKTGDRGALAEDGSLSLSYRHSDVVALGGREVPVGEIERALRAQGHIRHVAVIGRNRPHLVALVELDFPSVAAWARANSVRYGSLSSLAENERVVALIGAAVEAANRKLAEREQPQVKEFAVLGASEGFESTDVLALTGEVRRGEVEHRYRAVIDSLYRRSK
jgi:long-chain acyl-CoA synthetase